MGQCAQSMMPPLLQRKDGGRIRAFQLACRLGALGAVFSVILGGVGYAVLRVKSSAFTSDVLVQAQLSSVAWMMFFVLVLASINVVIGGSLRASPPPLSLSLRSHHLTSLSLSLSLSLSFRGVCRRGSVEHEGFEGALRFGLPVHHGANGCSVHGGATLWIEGGLDRNAGQTDSLVPRWHPKGALRIQRSQVRQSSIL